MTRQETILIMAYLRELYPNGKEITKETIDVWYDVLKDYDYETVKEATRETARTYEGYTMPPPAFIVRHITKTPKLKLYIAEPEMTEEQRRLADVAREKAMKALKLS